MPKKVKALLVLTIVTFGYLGYSHYTGNDPINLEALFNLLPDTLSDTE